MNNTLLRNIGLAGLFLIPFVPLVVSTSLFFPFITGKAFIFRTLIEIVFAVYLVLAIRDKSYRPQFSWILFSFIVFLVVMGLATLFSENPFKSFWSNYERMEGYVGLLHFFLFFIAMGNLLRSQELWNRLLATSLVASGVIAIWAIMQVSGLLVINQGGIRVDASLGNAAYLGIYTVFHIFFAGLLFVRYREPWQRIVLLVLALLNAVVLYYTATRGAILGFLGGVILTFLFLAWKSGNGSRIRKGATIFILAIILVAGGLFATRNTTFVKNNYVLSRFTTISLNEVQTQGRYFIWPMAIQGFLERPVLGWGQESFNFVFNKFYNPKMYNQEAWFDRAHNTFLDWLVAGGALGFLSYIALFLSLLFYVFKGKDEFLKREDKAIMLGLLSAYAFHNFFVFDQTSSYILFFTILAYTHSHATVMSMGWWDKLAERVRGYVDNRNVRPYIEAVVLLLLVASVYYFNYRPYIQNRELINNLVLINSKQFRVEEYKKSLKNYGMGFSESLEHLSSGSLSVANDTSIAASTKDELFKLIDEAYKRQLSRAPGDARYLLFYGMFLAQNGKSEEAITYLEKAVAASPKKQGIMLELVSNYVRAGYGDKAIALAKLVYEEEPSYKAARDIYSFLLVANGQEREALSLPDSLTLEGIKGDDRFVAVLSGLKKYDALAIVFKERIAKNPTNTQNRITYISLLMQANQNPTAITAIRDLIKVNPEFKAEGESLIKKLSPTPAPTSKVAPAVKGAATKKIPAR